MNLEPGVPTLAVLTGFVLLMLTMRIRDRWK